ncbi:MAG: gliding motility-associated C-terminal domain-containing protein [Bacteroidota bacterium]
MKPNLRNSILYVLICTLSILAMDAQILNKPVPADNPNLPGNSAWTAACASDDFNEYYVNFTWSPPLVNSDNEFILELSDAQGNFSNPVELDRATDMNVTFDFDFSFALPSNIQGDGHRFRVRSTSPALTSPESDAFTMFFIGYDNPILISQNGSGDIPSGGIIQACDGSSITLATHNVPDAQNYNYNWYRSGTLLSENSNAITVNEIGMYFVEIDYGNCSGSANTLSNSIEIQIGTNQGIAINPPASTALCSGETTPLVANITGQGYNYTWYKDGSLLTGPTLEGSTYVVDASTVGFEGDYELELSGSGICTERSAAIVITNADNFTVSRDNEATVVLLPSQTATLTVSTNATSPGYQWYKDGNPISGATNPILEVTEVGDYFARITQTGGACSSSSKDSEITTVVSPNSFEFVVEYSTTYNACSVSEVTLGLSEIVAVASDGSRSDVTQDMRNVFSYQWVQDGSDVAGETSSSLFISDRTNNGDYLLQGDIAGNYNVTSNVLPVQLRTDTEIAIESDNTVLCDGATAQLSTTLDLSGASYRWLRNGQPTGSVTDVLTATQSGDYQLEVTLDGCLITSNTVQIIDFDDSILVLDSEEDIIIVEGDAITVTASGANEYQWFDASNNTLATGNAFTFSEEGTFTLLATIDSCQITRTISVAFRDTFLVPNVITANGDGINDLWILPNTYSNDQEIRIIIFNEKGEEILNQTNYQNNWPQSSVAFNKKNQIFYYKIRNTNETLKQGTITVIR